MKAKQGQFEVSVFLPSLSASARRELLREIERQCPKAVSVAETLKIRASRVFLEISTAATAARVTQNTPVPQRGDTACVGYGILLQPRCLKPDCGPQSIAGDLLITAPDGSETAIPLTICRYLSVLTLARKCRAVRNLQECTPGNHGMRCFSKDLEATFDEFATWHDQEDAYLKSHIQIGYYISETRKLLKKAGISAGLLAGDMRAGLFLNTSPENITIVGPHPWSTHDENSGELTELLRTCSDETSRVMLYRETRQRNERRRHR